jgi:hypothetical protein
MIVMLPVKLDSWNEAALALHMLKLNSGDSCNVLVVLDLTKTVQ